MPPGRGARSSKELPGRIDANMPSGRGARSSNNMPSGRGVRLSKEAAGFVTEYEKERAKTVMRNNQVLQRLGVTALASLFNNAGAKSKDTAPEESGSLYEPEDDAETEQGVVDKVAENVPTKNMTMTVSMPSGQARVSKRVMQTQEQVQPEIVTRKRARMASSTEEGTNTNAQDDFAEAVLGPENAIAPAQPNDLSLTRFQVETNRMIARWNEGKHIGKELDRISRGLLTKIPVQVAEGKRRPEVPLQAAKLASEGGIILRHHLPILPHWKEYKKDKEILPDFMGKVAGHLDIDTKSKPMQYACTDILRGGQRQMRYKLKRAFFNGIPANKVRTTSPMSTMSDEQWKALVDMWSTPRHKENCVKAKHSREHVRFHQGTGSRSYIAHCHAVKQTKYKDVPPTAIDLFKECHCSSKTGFSEPVKDVIADMEAISVDSIQEGQTPKTPAEVISQVMPKSRFLQNVGLESTAPKRSNKAAAVASRVEDLEAELVAEKQCSMDLRETIGDQQDQLASLKHKVDESEAAMKKQQQEMENLKKSSDETNALLRRLLGINTSLGQHV